MISKSGEVFATIFKFNKNSIIKDWVIIDDVVMGGQSSSSFKLNAYGYGVFEGKVSLENNGGFCCLRYNCGKINVQGFRKISIRLKGDGKNYQLRIKANTKDRHSYIMPFSTSSKWQNIEIKLSDMYPHFRGKRLDKVNFSNAYFEEIKFLIGNKKNECFQIVIDNIILKP